MPDQAMPRPHWRLYGALVVAWLAVGLWATSREGTLGRIFIDVGYIVLPLLGAVVAFRRGLLVSGQQRLGWMIFVAAFLCWSFAGAVWTYYEVIAKVLPPFPGPSDLGFILYTLLAAVGFFFLSPRWAPRPRSYELLDLVTIALATAYATYHFALRGTLDQFGDAPLQTLVTLAYPAADVGAVAIVIFTVSRAGPGRHVQPLAIGLGLLLLAVVDATWIYLTTTGQYESGTPFDLLWHVSFMLVIMGFVYRPAASGEPVSSTPGQVRYLLPLGVAALISLLVVLEASERRLGLPEATFLSSLMLALAVRQGIAMRHNDVLRRDVQERANQLETANQKLAEAAQEKARFVNATAHELSNPLSPMAIQAKLLLNPEYGRDDAKRARSVELLQRAISRLSALVEDLVSIGRLEAGKMRIDPKRIDLAALVHDAGQFFAESAAKHDLRIAIETPEKAQATTDPDRVHQILANYLSNALKYSPSGSVIQLRLEREGPIWRIDVTDAGPGLTPAQQEKLFQPFSQVLESGKQQKGTGLGLYICRSLAERLGGQVGCRSDPGAVGSTFWLTLPGSGE